VNAGNLSPRWRMLIIALRLALAIGSASPTSLAQAAPAGELVNFSMKVINPKTTLKCGETVTYLVKVEVEQAAVNLPTPAPGPSGSPNGLPVIVTKVEAFSKDTSVGDFVGAKKGTLTTARTTVVFDDDLATLGTKFKFKANKVGKTTLYFDGLVEGQYVSDNLDVKVIPCKFKVKTILESPSEVVDTRASSGEAVVTPDENGNYTGSSTMSWVFSAHPPCTVVYTAPDSQVALTGRLDDDGKQFVATATFAPTTVSATFDCTYGSGSGQSPMVLPPLQFKASSSGGVSTQAFAGALATIIVVPEEDKAAAYIPGNPKARIGLPSPRWAMLWDDFSSLFSTLLALR